MSVTMAEDGESILIHGIGELLPHEKAVPRNPGKLLQKLSIPLGELRR